MLRGIKNPTSYILHPTSHKSGGFTLVELIIVGAVIAGLATIFITNYPGSQRKARDTLRRNDLRQYQAGLEIYANKNNGFYPSQTASVQADTVLCGNLGIASCAADPKDSQNVCTSGTCRYFYRSNGTCAAGDGCASEYFVYGRLEQPKDNLKPYWFYCSGGKSGEVATPPVVGSTCPVP